MERDHAWAVYDGVTGKFSTHETREKAENHIKDRECNSGDALLMRIETIVCAYAEK